MLRPEDTWRGGLHDALVRCARHPLVRRLARAGFLARGAVYAVVAALALALALGHGGETTDTRGALAALAATRVGRSLLVLLGVALAGLAVWFVLEALAPALRPPPNPVWAVVSRIGNALAAIAYFVLAVAAERLAIGEGAGPPTQRLARTWTGRVLELPGGRWLVLATAAVVVFVGARQAWRGVRRSFLEDLDGRHRARGRLGWWAGPLGAVGFAVQGTVFVLVGVFFAWAGLRNDPRMATGFDGALAAIASQRWGTALLGAVSLGLFAYAGYSLVEGRYRGFRR